MIYKPFFHRIIVISTILGVLLVVLGFFMHSLMMGYSSFCIILGYFLLIIGLIYLALENLISKLKGEYSYKQICLSTMFGALGFYLLTPLTFIIFKDQGYKLLFLIPATFSLIFAVFSVVMGVLFLKNRY